VVVGAVDGALVVAGAFVARVVAGALVVAGAFVAGVVAGALAVARVFVPGVVASAVAGALVAETMMEPRILEWRAHLNSNSPASVKVWKNSSPSPREPESKLPSRAVNV